MVGHSTQPASILTTAARTALVRLIEAAIAVALEQGEWRDLLCESCADTERYGLPSGGEKTERKKKELRDSRAND